MRLKYGAILIMVLLMCGQIFAEEKLGVHKNSVGLAFQIENVTVPLANYVDGVIAGVGVRFWLLEELVLRGLVFFDYNYIRATDQSVTRFGISAGAEIHFIKGIVSPYSGGFAGIEILADASATGADYHLGACIGVEITPLEFMAFFVEYSLLVKFREVGTEVDLGYNHLPTFGIIIYFN